MGEAVIPAVLRQWAPLWLSYWSAHGQLPNHDNDQTQLHLWICCPAQQTGLFAQNAVYLGRTKLNCRVPLAWLWASSRKAVPSRWFAWPHPSLWFPVPDMQRMEKGRLPVHLDKTSNHQQEFQYWLKACFDCWRRFWRSEPCRLCFLALRKRAQFTRSCWCWWTQARSQ